VPDEWSDEFECQSMHEKVVLKSHDYMLNSLSLELIIVISQFAMFVA
jgi:hypothetical protein